MLAPHLGFDLRTHLRRIQHALIRRLGFVINFLEATAAPFGLDQFGDRNAVIEIQPMHGIKRIELCDLLGRIVAPIAHTAPNRGPILFFDKGIIILAPDAPAGEGDVLLVAVAFQIQAFAIRTQ